MPEGHYTNIRCHQCGSHYVDSDVTEKYLDEVMATYVPEFHQGRQTYGDTVEKDVIRNAELEENWFMVARTRAPKHGDQLLDFGSAWGAFGNAAKQSGVVPNGIELQATGAAFSRELWGPASTVYEGPIETAPWPEKKFDYITSFETLEHVFDPIRILKKMRSLLKDNGVVAISVPASNYFEFKYWLYRKSPIGSWLRKNYAGAMVNERVLIHNHITTPSVRSVELWMEKAGLKVIHVQPYCSGLRGGRLGKFLPMAAALLWRLSFKRIAFAPSIFAIAVKA